MYRSTASGGPYAQITPLPLASAAYTDGSVATGTTYFYVVRAVDTRNNVSGNSNQAAAIAIDNLAPAAPTGVAVADRPADQGDGLIVSWAANAESDLAGYHVYRSTASGGPYPRVTSTPVTATTYTDTGLSAGVTSFYVVRALDVHTNEGPSSTEASAEVPANVSSAIRVVVKSFAASRLPAA